MNNIKREKKIISKSINIKRNKKTKKQSEDIINKFEVWGLKKNNLNNSIKKSLLISLNDKNTKHKINSKNLFEDISKLNYKSVFKSQNKLDFNTLFNNQKLNENTNTDNKSLNKKLLGKINLNILSRKKSQKKKTIDSITKMFKNDTVRSKCDDHTNFFKNSKSLKNSHKPSLK